MRLIFVVLLLAQIGVSGKAQNKWLRMQPEDWFALESVQKAFVIVKEDPDAYASTVTFEEGILSMIEGSQGTLFRRMYDLRLLLDSTGVNYSKSHNLGFNCGAKYFFDNNRCFGVGGFGYWNYHSQLIEFINSTGEWELQPTEEGPNYITMAASCWDGKNKRVISIDQTTLKTAGGELVRGIYTLPLDKDWVWEFEGQLNPALANHMEYAKVRSFALEEYFILVGLHKTLILRKADMACVLSDVLHVQMLEGPEQSLAPPPSGLRHVSSKNGVLTMRYTNAASMVIHEESWDIGEAFEASKNELIPLFAPVELPEPSVDEPKERGIDFGLLLVLALGSGAAGFLLRGGGRKKNHDNATEEAIASRDVLSKSNRLNEPVQRMSDLTLQFLALEVNSLDSAEINAMLALTDDLSEETKRARRANAIRTVNAEYQLWYNQPLIVRTKDKLDRRRTIYTIQRHSDNA